MKKVVIRADSSLAIGSGHIVRCISLAKELRNLGWEVHFLTILYKGNFNYLIEKQNFQLKEFLINKNDSQDRELNDARISKNYINKINPDLIVLDNYSLGKVWEKYIKSDTYTLAVIDDFIDRKHICDFLINQNFFDNEKKIEKKFLRNSIQPLIGPKFSLIDSSYRDEKKALKKKSNSVKTILLFFGGVDPDNVTSKVLRALKDKNFDQYHFELVIGAENPNKNEILEIFKEKQNLTIHHQLKSMAEVIARSDIAICSGGSNTWERACLGLPSLVITLAKNQVSYSKKLNELGYIEWLGDFRDIDEKVIRTKVLSFIKNSKKRLMMSKLSMGIVDGYGSKRVIETITNPKKESSELEKKLKKLSKSKLKITILSDHNSWLNEEISKFVYRLNSNGQKVSWCHDKNEVNKSDVCFILSFTKIIPRETLSKSKNNLVVHESDLPKGKGMSPMTWQILDGKNNITVTIFEASEKIDNGDIYFKRNLTLEGHELINEWRKFQAKITFEMCLDFLINYPEIIKEKKEQTGKETFFKKRNQNDSELEKTKTLEELFPKLRVVDNEAYPAFFKMGKHKYTLKIERMELKK